MSAANPHFPSDPALWEKTRAGFAQSPLADTPLASLAQDLDLPPWPVKAADETPSAYIYLNHDEAVVALASRGLPPSQLGHLIALLNDTNAFDQPFGEMMEDIAAPSAPTPSTSTPPSTKTWINSNCPTISPWPSPAFPTEPSSSAVSKKSIHSAASSPSPRASPNPSSSAATSATC